MKQPLDKDTYGLCVLKNTKEEIIDTQMMYCWTCVEQCQTWEYCDVMVFNTQTGPRTLLAGYCDYK